MSEFNHVKGTWFRFIFSLEKWKEGKLWDGNTCASSSPVHPINDGDDYSRNVKKLSPSQTLQPNGQFLIHLCSWGSLCEHITLDLPAQANIPKENKDKISWDQMELELFVQILLVSTRLSRRALIFTPLGKMVDLLSRAIISVTSYPVGPPSLPASILLSLLLVA